MLTSQVFARENLIALSVILSIIAIIGFVAHWNRISENRSRRFVVLMSLGFMLVVSTSFLVYYYIGLEELRLEKLQKQCSIQSGIPNCLPSLNQESRFNEVADNLVSSSETLLFVTVSAFLFMLMSFWDSFLANLNKIFKESELENEREKCIELFRSVNQLRLTARWYFYPYLAFLILDLFAVFLSPLILPILFNDPFHIMLTSLTIKIFTVWILAFSLLFLTAYVWLVHPAISELQSSRLLRITQDT